MVTKSDRFPKVGQKVRIEGRAGLYEVVRVDREHRVADATRRGNAHDSERDVPFKSILYVNDDVSKTIRHFLKS
jgi:hypothetical protein